MRAHGIADALGLLAALVGAGVCLLLSQALLDTHIGGVSALALLGRLSPQSNNTLFLTALTLMSGMTLGVRGWFRRGTELSTVLMLRGMAATAAILGVGGAVQGWVALQDWIRSNAGTDAATTAPSQAGALLLAACGLLVAAAILALAAPISARRR